MATRPKAIKRFHVQEIQRKQLCGPYKCHYKWISGNDTWARVPVEEKAINKFNYEKINDSLSQCGTVGKKIYWSHMPMNLVGLEMWQ